MVAGRHSFTRFAKRFLALSLLKEEMVSQALNAWRNSRALKVSGSSVVAIQWIGVNVKCFRPTPKPDPYLVGRLF